MPYIAWIQSDSENKMYSFDNIDIAGEVDCPDDLQVHSKLMRAHMDWVDRCSVLCVVSLIAVREC